MHAGSFICSLFHMLHLQACFGVQSFSWSFIMVKACAFALQNKISLRGKPELCNDTQYCYL